MAKLYFRHGAMGSAKTLNLLAVWHNYVQQGKQVKLLKPSMDDRFGQDMIRSRAGLEYKADMLVQDDTRLNFREFEGVSCVLVDECQFLSPALVDQLRELTRALDVPVIAYGLRTDFRTQLFPGSRRLLELADAIEEIKTTCMFCNRKAVFNLRHDGHGCAIVEGPSVHLGADDTYSPVCYPCYHEKVQAATRLRLVAV
ncbi:MAG TPA: thymidine kinase [Candidatus Xenobia bacterium]|jgi:thymidine kinase